jgi:hypothetical protein
MGSASDRLLISSLGSALDGLIVSSSNPVRGKVAKTRVLPQ